MGKTESHDRKQEVARKSGSHYRRHNWIGLATAQLFVKEGAYLFITGRRRKELDGP